MTQRSSTSPSITEPIATRTTRTPTQRSGIGMWAMISAWSLTVVMGMSLVWRYEHQPGVSGQSEERWPTDSEMAPAADRFTLLMFIHPKCPCTRASLDELARLMTFCQGRVEGHAVFVKPHGTGSVENWTSTDLWRAAEQIPGITTRVDVGGREARRFAALTSGQVYLFDADGNRCFQGGITASRGHSGDNAGRSSIVAWIHSGQSEIDRTEVFGCELGTEEGLVSCCQQ